MTKSSKATQLLCLIFFLSGSAALIFETLWFRVAGLVLGSSIWSAAAVLMAFMAGLAIGNGIMAFSGWKVTKPFQFYIYIEILIGLTGVLVIYLLPVISSIIGKLFYTLSDYSSLLHLIRFLIAFLILLLPAIAMGMTLPVIQKCLLQYHHSFTQSLGILYGWNTIGAVAGTLIAEFILITYIGIKGSALFACFLNFSVVLILYKFFKTDLAEVIAIENNEGSKQQNDFKGKKRLLIAPFLAGFLLLALEVIWFRYMILVRSATSNVFATMLAAVLISIGIGGLISSRLKIDPQRLQKLLFILPMISALMVAISYYLFSLIFFNMPDIIEQSIPIFYIAALILMLPVSVISGVLFPLFGENLYNKLEVTTKTSGILTLTNTLGAAIGSGIATFYLLPILGIEYSLLILSIAYIVLSLLTFVNIDFRQINFPKKILSVITITGLLVFLFPYGTMEKSYQWLAKGKFPDWQLIKIKEGLNETLHYYKIEKFNTPIKFKLATNSISMSDTGFVGKRYMAAYVYVPYALKQDIKDVLQISYGVGNTAEAVISLPSMESFDVVDISEDIFNHSSIIHEASGRYPLQDKRTTYHIEDGRFFLQTVNKKYDLITAEPPPPKNAGVVNLYTQEYFQLVYDKLNENGLATYWLPTHDLYPSDSLAIIKAFCLVFMDCSLWNGAALDFMLTGSKNGIKPVNDNVLSKIWKSELRQDLVNIGLEEPEHLLAMFMADSITLLKLTETIAPVTDNYPHRISPNQEGMRLHSKIYAYFLDINRRKEALLSSQYIADIFSPALIHRADNAFRYEKNITDILLPEYASNQQFYWDNLSHALTETDYQVIPGLLLLTTPDHLAVLDNANNRDKNSVFYHINYSKLLIIERRYKEAVSKILHYIRNVKDESNNKNFMARLCLLASALSDQLNDKLINELVSLGYFSEDDVYITWIKKKFMRSYFEQTSKKVPVL